MTTNLLSRALCMLAWLAFPLASSAAELPEDSVYGMNAMLETHSTGTVAFDSLQGQPVIVSMFYGSCPHVCPMLISSIQEIEKQLPKDARERLRVAMISIDPARDTPDALRQLAERHRVDSDRWLLARTATPDETRALAAVLGIKYKALPDGEFNHTTSIILLDEQGREIARSGKLGAPDPAFVEQVRRALER